MGKNRDTSKLIDTVLYGLAFGTLTGTMLIAPNAIEVLDKPLNKFFDNLDERQKQREISKLRSYLKTSGLVHGDYEHGIVLTKKALKRVEKYEFDNLKITVPATWDKTWQIVVFDIPETNRDGRVLLTSKLQALGYQLLQQSLWIHPFESKDVVYAITERYGVTEWVTYLQTSNIDNEEKLLVRFRDVLGSSCLI